MKLVMKTNLGLQDAKRLGIEASDATEGDTIDVDGAVAEELVKRGWAEAATSKPEPPKPAVGKPDTTSPRVDAAK